MTVEKTSLLLILVAALLFGCSGNEGNNSQNGQKSLTESQIKYGIGPVEEIQIDGIDQRLAGAGQRIFQNKCTKCHLLDKPLLGPPLRDVAGRRTPEFIMNVILNTQEMVMRHPALQEYHKQYNIYMTAQGIDRAGARALLEYLRQVAPEDSMS